MTLEITPLPFRYRSRKDNDGSRSRSSIHAFAETLR